ncbi:peptidylprolyl isomerase [Paenibacillus tarimensis]
MNKYSMLKGLIALQAVCMVTLTVIVVVHMLLPVKAKKPADIGKAGDEKIIAEVGGEKITEQELHDRLRRLYGTQELHTLLVRRAIGLEAEQQGITVSGLELEEELSRMMQGYEGEADFYKTMRNQLGLGKEDILEDTKYRLLLEQIAIRQIDVSDEEVQAYKEAHPELFSPGTTFHLSWIVTHSLQLANQVIDKLESGEEFAKLAKQYSIDSFTADNGGDLGYIESDDPFIDKEVLDAAAELETGRITGPIPVERGYAVIYLTERQMKTPFDEDRQREYARRQAALQAAKPLTEIESELLEKYDASIHRQP